MDEIHPLTKHKIAPLCIFNSADPEMSTHPPIHSGNTGIAEGTDKLKHHPWVR